MPYKIIRVKDNQVVEPNLTEEEANRKIIFYDTEADPHRIEKPDSHE